ncbi:MAG: hypothetical protein AMJ60_03920 [Desulfobacterales bacterium SG8_35]|nr:MAG: hypothetical protein AMJ60_03920 [Desulfobacterales bacterium SG8_35]
MARKKPEIHRQCHFTLSLSVVHFLASGTIAPGLRVKYADLPLKMRRVEPERRGTAVCKRHLSKGERVGRGQAGILSLRQAINTFHIDAQEKECLETKKANTLRCRPFFKEERK